MRIAQDAFFLPVGHGERFCVWRAPVGQSLTGVVVHVPAFGEEMNKARHVTAAGARALAGSGLGVLALDLFGCGDSSGDFADADWDIWIDDVIAATQWARARCDGRVWLWSLRAGALLAAAAVHRVSGPVSLLLWQPVLSGRQHLMQFLRIGLAGDVTGERVERGRTKLLLDRLGRGEAVEVAGYALSARLADGLAAAEFAIPGHHVEHVAWLEVDALGRDSLSPAAAVSVAALRSARIGLDARVVPGPGFWQAVELEDCPALIDASVAMLAHAA